MDESLPLATVVLNESGDAFIVWDSDEIELDFNNCFIIIEEKQINLEAIPSNIILGEN